MSLFVNHSTKIIEVVNNTQFVWLLNKYFPIIYMDTNKNIIFKNVNTDSCIYGYIGSVKDPSHRFIKTNNKIATINFYVDGKLTEIDILRLFPNLQTKIPVNYFYGQIHYFESNKNNEKSDLKQNFQVCDLKNMIEPILYSVIDEWDEFRIKNGDFGDIYNDRVTIRNRLSSYLANVTMDEYLPSEESFYFKEFKKWCNELKIDAADNIQSYADCFAIENLLRKYINYMEFTLCHCSIQGACEYRGRHDKKRKKLENYPKIRKNDEDIYYLGIDKLALNIDVNYLLDLNSNFIKLANEYSPIRDTIAHTGLITDEAKKLLSIVHKKTKVEINKLLDYYGGLSEDTSNALIDFSENGVDPGLDMFCQFIKDANRSNIQVDESHPEYIRWNKDSMNLGLPEFLEKIDNGELLTYEEIEIVYESNKLVLLPEIE